MAVKTLKVTATPFDNNKWAVECNQCNFMALVGAPTVDRILTIHAHTHREGK